MQKFIRKFQSASLNFKLFFSLFCFIIIPLVISVLYFNGEVAEMIENKNKEEVLQSLEQSKKEIEQMITETEDLSYFLLGEPSVQKMGSDYTYKNVTNLEKEKLDLSFSVRHLLESKKFIHSLSFSSGEEILYQYGDKTFKEEIKYQNEALALDGRPYWTDIYSMTSRVGEEPVNVISLVRTVKGFNTFQPIGSLRISIAESTIQKAFQSNDIWKSGEMFLMDNNATLLSSTEKKNNLGRIENQSLVNELMTEDSAVSQMRVNGVSYLFFTQTIDETGWKVIHSIAEHEVMQEKALINKFIVLMVLLILIFGFLYAWIQFKSINKPLESLVLEMDKVRTGVFDNISLQVRGKDEIGKVSLAFLDMVKQLKELIEKVYKSQIKEQQAKLKALEAQMNPHFLFNTLDSIYWLSIKNKDYEVSEQIAALSDIFKLKLDKGPEKITIQEEVDFVKSYLFIAQKKLGDRLEVFFHIDEELLDCETLKLTLQPLVENAIQHGLESKVGKGNINITVTKEAKGITMIVEDDGVGTEEMNVIKSLSGGVNESESIALKNIADRISLQYGGSYGLSFSSKVNQGTIVKISIPYRKRFHTKTG